MARTGIDYSLGRSNVNHETGINFGVISQNSVDLDVIFEAQMQGADYGKPTCPSCGLPVESSGNDDLFANEDYAIPDWFDGKDFTCVPCQTCYWSDSVYSDEMLGWSHDADGYKLADCLDTDIFVLESPYFTFAEFCSPCVPGAGNLDSAIDPEELDHEPHALPTENKTYRLGPEWFDSENPMPYRCFKVSDGSEIATEAL